MKKLLILISITLLSYGLAYLERGRFLFIGGGEMFIPIITAYILWGLPKLVEGDDTIDVE